MMRSWLVAYQWATGLSDTLTGALLYMAPAFTLRTMGLPAPAAALPYISYIGAFVLSVGIACLYGALVLRAHGCPERIETVWLLTAISRAAVSIFLVQAVIGGTLVPLWIGIALFDATCVVVQAIGLRRGWLRHAL